MNALELLEFQLNDGSFQLRSCFEPMTDAQLDHRSTPEAMTPREMAVHLAECYEAFLAECEGRKHSWGSYALADTSRSSVLANLWNSRERAVAAALSNPDHVQHAHAFMVAHDAYHVGQLCLVHLATTPGWDPYSIYKL